MKQPKRSKLGTYTVIGICEEERHAVVVKAQNPGEAEDKAIRKHDKKPYRLIVAGVAKGKVRMVDDRGERGLNWVERSRRTR